MLRCPMLSRREVLVGSALSLFLARCTCTPKPATLTPLERWQALLDALRQSPDHLAAAADAAVASKDPALIFAFVRD